MNKTIKVGQIVVVADRETGFPKGTICKLVMKGKFKPYFDTDSDATGFDAICVAPNLEWHNKQIQEYFPKDTHLGYGYFQFMHELRPATESEKIRYRKEVEKERLKESYT